MPGTCVSETSWHRAKRYRRASGMVRWVRAPQGYLQPAPRDSVHLHALLPVGARVRVPCGRWPAGSGSGPSAALRAHTRGLIAPAAAARSLRACARRSGLLHYSCQARLTRPESCPPLPSTARQPGHAPPEPAACCARGRSPSADPARSRVSACSSLNL